MFLTRRRLVFGFLAAAVFAACAPSLAELDSFPCANDGTCPPGFTCNAESKCVLGSGAVAPAPVDAAVPQADAADAPATTSPDALTPDATVDAKADAADAGDATVDAKADAADAKVDAADAAAPCADGGASLATDPANCGSCGRSCKSASGTAGTCQSGECEPEIRVKGVTSAVAEVVTDGTSTVYQDQDKIYKCAILTCASTTSPLYADGGAATMGGPLLLAGGNLYFAGVSSGTNVLAKWVSGAASPGVHTKLTPTALAGDANALFAAEDKVIYSGSHTSASLTVLMTAGAIIKSMALSKSDLYYFESGVGIRRCPRTGSCGASSVKVVNMGSGEHPFAVANETLYWVDNATGTVLSCVLPGCSSNVKIATGQASAARIVADSRGVYWGGQDVYACFKAAGCTQTELHHFVPAGSTTGASVVSMVSVGKDLVWTYASSGLNSLQRVTANP